MTLADLPVRRDVPAVSAAQMAEADRITIEDVRLPVEVLMESASRQIAAGARAYLGSAGPRNQSSLSPNARKSFAST